MNRQERKKMEKVLKLDKFYKTLSRTARFEKIRNNQENGKRMNDEFKAKVSSSIQQQDDQKESNVISSLAELISTIDKIPFIDALEKAKVEYDNMKAKKV